MYLTVYTLAGQPEGMNDESLTVPEDDDPLTPYQRMTANGSTPLDLRQQLRMPPGYEASSAEVFDPRLAYELALEMDAPVNVFAKYGKDEGEAVRLLQYGPFIGQVKKYRDEIVAGGVSFKLKAKVQAEDLLTHSYEMATDPEVPPSVRADLIKWTAAVAGLGPPRDVKGEGGGAGGAEFTLAITFKGAGPAGASTSNTTIDVTPTSKELTA